MLRNQFVIWHFGTDNLLNYIADSSSNLRSLRVAKCSRITEKGVVEAVVKLPLLEELGISNSCVFSGESLRVVGQSCPNLKTLKLNCRPFNGFVDEEPNINNNNAVAIAETMPELRHLQIIGNGLDNTGLNAILDACPHLEHLDLRRCLEIDFVGDLKKRCFERIKVLRRPYVAIDFLFHSTMNIIQMFSDPDYVYGDVDPGFDFDSLV